LTTDKSSVKYQVHGGQIYQTVKALSSVKNKSAILYENFYATFKKITKCSLNSLIDSLYRQKIRI